MGHLCYFCLVFITGLGAKSQNLSSVAPPRKKKLVTIFSQGHVWGLRNPCFTKFSVVNFL